MKKILFIALLSLATMRITGQTLNVDSLINMLETKRLTSDEQLQIYIDLCTVFSDQDDERRLLYTEKGLALAGKEKDKLRMAIFNNFYGNYYLGAGDHDLAINYFKKVLDLSIEIKDSSWEAKAYGNLGVVYSNKKEMASAIEYYKKAISFYERIGREDETAIWLANIGGQYRLLGEYRLAADYLKRAEYIAEKTNDERALLRVYPALGNLYWAQKELDIATEYGLKALLAAEKLQSKSGAANALQTLTIIASEKGDWDEAEKYADECLRLAEEANNRRFILIAWNALTGIYLNQGRYEETIAAANMVWETDSANLNVAATATCNAAYAYIILSNKEKSIEFLNKYISLQDEISKRTISDNLMEMEVKYETEKKETRIATLEKERQLYLWLIVSGGLLLAALIIMLLLTVRNARKQRRLIAAEALQEGELSERSRIAQDLHDRLGSSLSAVKIGLANEETLHIVSVKLDSCIKELREITNNIMPRSLQIFGMKGALEDFSADIANLHFHFFGEAGRIRPNQEYTVYCCARELVNNALKHSGAATVNLQLVQSKKYVTLTVQDDGCGFDEKTVKKGNGLTNIRNRVASCKGRIDVSSTPGKGTEAVIELLVQ